MYNYNNNKATLSFTWKLEEVIIIMLHNKKKNIQIMLKNCQLLSQFTWQKKKQY